MISVRCKCGNAIELPESRAGQRLTCDACGLLFALTCGETLDDHAGVGDFDTALVLRKSPVQSGMPAVFYLGGVADLEIGKLPEKHLSISGTQVSRNHASLLRLDFGPGRWKIRDNKSTNGLFVNDLRVLEQELKFGDKVRIGEYEFQFANMESAPAPIAAATAMVGAPSSVGTSGRSPSPSPASTTGGPKCPSCGTQLPTNAKICVSCGINIKSGRPISLSQGVDEDRVYGNAESLIRVISFFIAVTPLPIPIASEGFGNKKPYFTRAIAIITIVTSLVFYFTIRSDPKTLPGKNLMLWSGSAASVATGPGSDGSKTSPTGQADPQRIIIPPKLMDKIYQKMDAPTRQEFNQIRLTLRGKYPDDELNTRALEKLIADERARRIAAGENVDEDEEEEFIAPPKGEFHAYQLITHAFLHDFSNIFGLIAHLAGNMLFLLVFGTRVNALLGNVRMGIIYFLLAIGAGISHIWFGAGPDNTPMLGASGAIMGLAGMYLIFFPIQRVHCAMWLRLGLLTGFKLVMKVFAVRGFWILGIYFIYDILMQMLIHALGGSNGGGTAHFAHIGGFVSGMIIAVVLLIARQAMPSCDLLSLILGKGAWAILGTPAQRQKLAATPA